MQHDRYKAGPIGTNQGYRWNVWARRSLPAALAVLVLQASGLAQEPPAEPNWEAIRKTPFAAIDRRTTQLWVDAQVQRLLTGDNVKAIQDEGTALYGKIMTHTNAADATKEFQEACAELLADSFTRQYRPTSPSGTSPQPLGTAMILLVLRDLNHRSAFPCFRAALGDRAPGPRLLAAEGIFAARASLNEQDWTALLAELQKVASAETNGVTLSYLYRILNADTPARIESVIPVLLAILDNRFALFEQKGRLPTTADGEAVKWLADRADQINNVATRIAVTSRVARLLTDATDVYINEKLRPGQAEEFEKLIVAVETALESVVKSVARSAAIPNPTVRDAMLAGGDDRQQKMADAVIQWIGSASSAGLLSQAPFNLPAGLDIQRKVRTPTSAPASQPAAIRPTTSKPTK